jgi:hypothetical protein
MMTVRVGYLPMGLGLVVAMLSLADGADRSAARDVEPLIASFRRLADQPADSARAVQATRLKLTSSIQQLEQFLAGGGSEIAGRWSEFLGVSTLKQELDRAQPDVAALRSIEDRFYQNRSGLELPPFVAVRRNLREFLAASDYATADSPDHLYRECIAELTECLARLGEQPAELDAHRAGACLAWLQALSDDGASLARQAQSRFCRANGLAQGSGRLANLLMQRTIQERNYITEMILGSLTRGLAVTQGRLMFGMVPDPGQGTLEIRLNGNVQCPANVADRGRISVYTSASTTIDARKQISVDDQGLRLARATAFCSTNVQIQDIEAPRFVERVAWRRASRLTPEAEQLTSRRAESEATAKLDREADAALGRVNGVFCEKIRAPLIRFNALPANLQFWSDASLLHLSLSQHNDLQLAAAGPPPAMPPSYDLAGCVHESMINNLCEATLGGKTIQDEIWLDIMHLLLGAQPRPLWVHDRAERWSVTFAKERPLLAYFNHDRLGLTLRFIAVTKGEREIAQLIEIEARFIPQITRDGPALLRDGNLAIRFMDGSPNEAEETLRPLLASKFGAVFPPELHFYGLMPPAGGSLGKLRQLQTAEFRAADGWLSLGYQLAPK